MGMGSAALSIGHDHDAGVATFTLECPHGSSTVTQRIGPGDEWPEGVEPEVMEPQAGIHDRLYRCGCAIRFLEAERFMMPNRRSDA